MSGLDMNTITVLLVDDHNLVREGIRLLLESSGQIEVVGEADNGLKGISMAEDLVPNIVLMDVSMPLLDGAEATRHITQRVPSTKVLMLSCHEDDTCVQQAVEAGAVGYLLKHSVSTELISMIRAAARGETLYHSRLFSRVRWRGPAARAKNQRTRLTSREAEVLQLIAVGRANKQIAADLSISIKTVEKHRQQVMNKLNIHNIAGLTRYAMIEGMVS